MSDQGRNFESNVSQQLCCILGILKCRTTPYHPMTNGLCERLNQTLIRMLRTLTQDKKANWKSHVASLVHAYNASRHDSTKYSPFYLMFGRHPRLTVDVLFGLWEVEEVDEDESQFVSNLRKQLDYAYNLAAAHQTKAGNTNKRNYDAKVRGAVPVVGDRVLLKNVGIRGKHKLADKWEKEVYVIVERPDPALPVYSIRKEGTRTKCRNVHRNMLLPLSFPELRKPRPSAPKTATPSADPSSSSTTDRIVISIPRDPSQSSTESSSVLSRSQSASESSSSVATSPQSEDDDSPLAPVTPPPRRSNRVRAPPKWLQSGDFYTYAQQCSKDSGRDSKVDIVFQMYSMFLEHQNTIFRDILSMLSSWMSGRHFFICGEVCDRMVSCVFLVWNIFVVHFTSVIFPSSIVIYIPHFIYHHSWQVSMIRLTVRHFLSL